jgi:ammonium transporter Rh
LAFIGTIFLFLYWPSFNAVSVSAPATAVQQNYIVPNTYFAIAASVLAAFTLSSLYNKGKLRIEDILNASLAGGVIIGANSNLTADIGTAILIGLLGGVISTVGFNKLTPALSDSGFLHDTAGVTNLHALPGLFGGLISAILANNLSGTTAISGQLQNIFPAEFNIIHRSPST